MYGLRCFHLDKVASKSVIKHSISKIYYNNEEEKNTNKVLSLKNTLSL